VQFLRNISFDELAEEYSGQFEGDIVISDEQMNYLENLRRIGHRDTKYRWKNSIVPYQIDKIYFSEFTNFFDKFNKV
jgi:hypothetical protein